MPEFFMPQLLIKELCPEVGFATKTLRYQTIQMQIIEHFVKSGEINIKGMHFFLFEEENRVRIAYRKLYTIKQLIVPETIRYCFLSVI